MMTPELMEIQMGMIVAAESWNLAGFVCVAGVGRLGMSTDFMCACPFCGVVAFSRSSAVVGVDMVTVGWWWY
jgi:hypothetical protein